MRVGSLLLGLLRRIGPVLFEGLRAFGAAYATVPLPPTGETSRRKQETPWRSTG